MALFMNLVLGAMGELTSSTPFPRATTQKKRVLGLPTHSLCVNKCLQFYMEDGMSVRAADCIFFTFIDLKKTIILYICVLGGAVISFMANSWYC